MNKVFFLVALVLFGVAPSLLRAHDYWIMPENFHPEQDKILEVAFTNGHHYFENEAVPDVTRFDMFYITPQGEYIPLAYTRVEPKAAWARVPIGSQGTYVIGAASTSPEYWCKTTDGYKPGLKADHPNAITGGKYVKSLKTYINVGAGSESFRKALGHEIEIMPQTNPSSVKAGQQLLVSVLFKSEPLAGVPVYGVYEGFKPKDHSDQPIQTKTGKNGVASIKVDRAGIWIVFAKHEIAMAGGNEADFANYRPYMMFQVR